VVFDDFFTTVPYTKKCEVPPNWSELVKKSSEQVTGKNYDLAKTWLFPDANSGDTARQTNSRTTTVPPGISNDVPTMANNNSSSALQSGHQIPQIDFSRSNEAQGIFQKDSFPCPYSDSVLCPLQNNNSVPALVNFETLGLRRLPQLAAL
jgi:hypothetical protein